jgi:hypothetical protein
MTESSNAPTGPGGPATWPVSAGPAPDTPSGVDQTTDEAESPPVGSAQEKAAQVGQTAKDSGGQVAQTAAEQVKTVAAEAGRQTRDLLGEARGQLTEQAGSQQQKAVSGLRGLVDELQSMAEKGGQTGPATELAQQASDRVRRAADWLEQRQPGDLLDELRRWARSRPGAFLAGAALAGVLAGRLTRGVVAASSSDAEPATSDRQLTGSQPSQPTQPYWPAQTPESGAGYPTAPPAAPFASSAVDALAGQPAPWPATGTSGGGYPPAPGVDPGADEPGWSPPGPRE